MSTRIEGYHFEKKELGNGKDFRETPKASGLKFPKAIGVNPLLAAKERREGKMMPFAFKR